MGFFWWLELGKAPKQAYFIETPKQGVFVGFEAFAMGFFLVAGARKSTETSLFH